MTVWPSFSSTMPTRRRLRRQRRCSAILLAATAVIGLSRRCVAAADGTSVTGTDASADGSSSRSRAEVHGDYYFDISDWDDAQKNEAAKYAEEVYSLGNHVKWPWSLSDEEKQWVGLSSEEAIPNDEEVGVQVARRRLQSAEDSTGEILMESKETLQRRDSVERFHKKGDGAKIDFSIRGSGNKKNPPVINKSVARQNTVDTFRCYDDDPDLQVPCPPNSFGAVCDKYSSEGSFRACFEMCKPSFCCIHDSLSKTYSPSCAIAEPNCPSYFPCYIVWWKLHDTIGPANYLRTEQDEPFYDMSFEEIKVALAGDPAGPFSIFQQLFGHHFDTDDEPTDATFEDPDNW